MNFDRCLPLRIPLGCQAGDVGGPLRRTPHQYTFGLTILLGATLDIFIKVFPLITTSVRRRRMFARGEAHFFAAPYYIIDKFFVYYSHFTLGCLLVAIPEVLILGRCIGIS